MRKKLLIVVFILVSIYSYSQTNFESKSKVYSFKMPDEYTSQPSANDRNEFVFVSKADTTSLVVNVNEQAADTKWIESFKKATNADVEKNYFNVLKSPKIITRGELNTYKDKTIFFHLNHTAGSALENNFMLTYLFYHKGKAINFIFRTKERRLEKVLPAIEKIVNSVVLID